MSKYEAQSQRASPLPNPYRWMLFVDGENFTLRGQEVAERHSVSLWEGRYYESKNFLWMPGGPAHQSMYPFSYPLQLSAIRAYYYTSVIGDEARREKVREALWSLGFSPHVFRREKGGRSKGVDISLATDLLNHAFRGSYDVAILVAGDGDYVPLVEEVKRLGRMVQVAFFAAGGLSQELRLRADGFCDLTTVFLTRWRSESPPAAPGS